MNYFKNKILCGLAFGALLLCIANCAAMAEEGHVDYNSAVQRFNGEQLLLNLVRLRYNETPLFLRVDSVESQGEFIGPTGQNAPKSPLFTYTPVQGQKFARKVLAPISINNIALLFQSGCSFKRLLHLCARQINGVKNSLGVSGPTPEYAPGYKHFTRIAELFQILQKRGLIDMVSEKKKADGAQISLHLQKQALTMEKTIELTGLMDLTPKPYYKLSANPAAKDPGAITLQTRSIFGVLRYLSHCVKVPAEDEKQGKVAQTRTYPDGSFDWSKAVNEIMQIHTSTAPPENSSVAVKHRGNWFFINDTDMDSKSTFTLLAQLFALQS